MTLGVNSNFYSKELFISFEKSVVWEDADVLQ